MITLYDINMALAFVILFCCVHLIFKNIRQICLWSAKLCITGILWSFLWIATQLDHLPQWKNNLIESMWRLVNVTKGEL